MVGGDGCRVSVDQGYSRFVDSLLNAGYTAAYAHELYVTAMNTRDNYERNTLARRGEVQREG